MVAKDTEGEHAHAPSSETADQSGPIWTLATLDDVAAVDFEGLIQGAKSADASELSDIYLKEAKAAADAPEGHGNQRQQRVFAMLGAAAGMHFKPADRNAPYGPMMSMADGRRTAIPEDFRGPPLQALAELATRAQHPALRARLSDVCWLVDRKLHHLARAAIASLVEIISLVEQGELAFRFEKAEPALSHDVCDHQRRAIQIGRALGNDEGQAARALADHLRRQAVSKHARGPVRWFSDLDLEFGVSDPTEVAADIESIIAGGKPDGDPMRDLDLWRLAAKGYHIAKDQPNAQRCQLQAAECLVAQADLHQSAFLEAHWLSDALAELTGLPDQKEKRRELRHRLVDVQMGALDELTSFSQEMDLREIIEGTENALEPLGFVDMLFVFAALAASPDPKELAENAAQTIREHPLSTLFSSSLMDGEGKVIHRSPGSDLSGGADDPAVAQQIAQSERIRRNLVFGGMIRPAQRYIADRHYVSEDVLRSLLEQSPFVPSDLVWTFARGFTRFFQGDAVSALYILTPMLENSLRYILKQHGHDVTIFDEVSRTQQDRTISSLFEQMRDELDDILTPAITTDIENVFLVKLGPSLRHTVAHGLLNDGAPFSPDAAYACWLIFRLCILPLWSFREKIVNALEV